MKHILLFENFKGLYEFDIIAKEIDLTKFDNPGKINDPSFFTKGRKDGRIFDDMVETKPSTIPAKYLKPSQNAIYLGKALGLAIDGIEGGDLGMIVSKENMILDGHHRWAATLFNNPDSEIIVEKADLGIGDLIPVLRQAGDALGNPRGTEPKGGDINIFEATMEDVEDCIYSGKGMNDKFFNQQKALQWYNQKRENIEYALNLIKEIGYPEGALPRYEMPKVKKFQAKKVANDLSAGRIDVRAPYFIDKNKDI